MIAKWFVKDATGASDGRGRAGGAGGGAALPGGDQHPAVVGRQETWGQCHQQFSSFVPPQPQSSTAPRPVVISVANNYKRNS